MGLKHRLAGIVVAASIAASGTAALANTDDIQADLDGSDVEVVARAHGSAISELARSTESGPGKGAIVSAAASAHGKATSEAAKQRHADEDADTDEDLDTDEDTGVAAVAEAGHKPADAGAKGAETAAAAKADGKAFGQAKAEAAKSKRR